MGNRPSLRVSIQREKWEEVRSILDTTGGRDRAANKVYSIRESGGSEAQSVTALHLACEHKAPEDVIRKLLEIKDANVLSTSYPGMEVPLHYAVRPKGTRSCQEGAIEALLDCPFGKESLAFVSAANRGGRSPLHLACVVRAPPPILQRLVEANPAAAQTLRDGTGKTAYEVAKSHWWLRSPVWRWRVSSILTTPTSTSTSAIPVPASSSPPPMAVPTAPAMSKRFNTKNQQQHLGEESVFGVEDADVCVVCWDGTADNVLIPCGHMCLCSNCADDQTIRTSLGGQCPVCKAPAERAMKVFKAGVPNPEAPVVAIPTEAPPPPTVPRNQRRMTTTTTATAVDPTTMTKGDNVIDAKVIGTTAATLY